MPGRMQTENTVIVPTVIPFFLSVTVNAFSGIVDWYLFFTIFEISAIILY